MLQTLETVWAPRVLTLVRIVAALIFLEHGTQKLFGFPPSPMWSAVHRCRRGHPQANSIGRNTSLRSGQIRDTSGLWTERCS